MTDYPRPAFDTTRPHSARVWNYFLGGKDNFPVDRAHADKVMTIFPDIVDVARASRNFLARAVSYLTSEAGIRQFLDVGTGLPVENNTHQVAQGIAPESRIVYVDHDPLVLAHARALLVGTPEGDTAYLDLDAREPERILEFAAETLDLSQPVGLMLMSIIGLLPDLDEAYSVVRTLLAALPPGSYLVLEDGSVDEPDAAVEDMGSLPDGYGYRYRTTDQIRAFFDGLDLVEPGIVSPSYWRNDPAPGSPVARHESCGVGRKP